MLTPQNPRSAPVWALGLLAAVCGTGCSGLEHKETAELWTEGDQAFDQGRYDDAKPYYSELLRRNDADTRARVMRGVSHERTGQDSDALSDFGTAGTAGDVRAYLYSADLNIRRGDYPAAEADLARLKDMGLGGRDTVVQLTLLGTLRLKQGQFMLAAQNLERALETGQTYADGGMLRHLRDAHYNGAQAYYHLGDFERAYGHMLAYAGLSPDTASSGGGERLSPEDSYTLGLLAYLAGDFDASEHHLANADPALVANGAKVLDDPSFGARLREEHAP